jgi:hypothetical protein
LLEKINNAKIDKSAKDEEYKQIFEEIERKRNEYRAKEFEVIKQ